MERSYEDDNMPDADDPDRESLLMWRTRPHGFVDIRAVEAEMCNSLLDFHLPWQVLSREKSDSGWLFRLGHELTIEIRCNATEQLSVVATSNYMNRKWLDGIRAQLRFVLQSGLTQVVDAIGFTVVILQLVEEALAFLDLWRQNESDQALNEQSKRSSLLLPMTGPDRRLRAQKAFMQQTEGWDGSDITDWKVALLGNPYGVNPSTIKDEASHILGKAIQDICSAIPDWLRIINIEP